jgi:lipoprotein-anchoring transpeptidase ErfK/SrfK
MNRSSLAAGAIALATGIGLSSTAAFSQPLALFEPSYRAPAPYDRMMREPPAAAEPRQEAGALPAHLRRQIVSYTTREAPGTIIVDTPNTYLYYVLGNGRAVRYGIGVGREGFAFSGVNTIARKAEWPDWTPPPQMIERQPYLPRWMAGGPGNPMGAAALYLGNSLYRIHGTNVPSSIGQRVSSGCIRMLNEDVQDLYRRVQIGARVVVLPDTGQRHREAANQRRRGHTDVSASARSGSRVY